MTQQSTIMRGRTLQVILILLVIFLFAPSTFASSTGGIDQTELLYVTSTVDYDTEPGTPDLASTQDGDLNEISLVINEGNLYTYINAETTPSSQGAITSDQTISFSSYWSTGSSVDFAYATFKLFIDDVLVCQDGDDNTGGALIPSNGAGLRTGSCSPSTDFSFNTSSTLRYQVNLWADSISGGPQNNRRANLQWDTVTADTWVEIESIMSTQVTLDTDEESYEQLDTITASGVYSWLNNTPIQDADVTVRFYDSTNALVQQTITQTNSLGEYSQAYTTSTSSEIGDWHVNVTAEFNDSISAAAEKTFSLAEFFFPSDLECEVQPTTTCSSGWTKYLGLENETGGYNNSHAQTHNYAGTTYANSLCCRVTSQGELTRSCTDGDVLASLSSEDNAHVQDNTQTGYSVDVCLSHSDEPITCTTRTTVCESYEECVLSISNIDNAHAGSCGFYERNICCFLQVETGEPFITTWKTDNPGPSDDNQISLPLQSSGTYNFEVDWGDGNQDTITTWNQAETTHTYASAGTYNVTITGTIEGWRFNNGGDRQKILDVVQWGDVKLGNSGDYFWGASNMIVSAEDELNISGMTNFRNFFSFTNITTVSGMDLWDVSSVTNFYGMFWRATSFNQDISSWDTSSATNMAGMFYFAEEFNQPIGSWNTSQVTDMHLMFVDTLVFNQSLNTWDTSQVTNMSGMFWDSVFNQPLNNWDVSSVTDMHNMFISSPFNQNISSWDVSSVTDMSYMFYFSEFNQPINSWNTSNVETMFVMFSGSPFNQPLNNWDTSSVTNMEYMFYDVPFDQDISSWNVTSVTSFLGFLGESQLSTTNYNALLNGWSSQTVQTTLDFGGGASTYSFSGVQARETLTDTYDWNITDGGLIIESPTLLTPANDDHTVFDRYPTFNWSTPETVSGVWHELNITTPATCSSIAVINTTSSTEHTSVDELCVDEVYEWTARTCYKDTCSDWAEPFNFTITSVVGISFTQNVTNFGELEPSIGEATIEDTLDNAPNPLVINNTGNVRIDLSVRAQEALWDQQPLGTRYFQYADQDSTDWQNVTESYTSFSTNLLYDLTRELELRVEVPSGEGAGAKTTIIQAQAVSAE